MSLFDRRPPLAKCGEPAPAKVIPLVPDGVRIRRDGDVYWVERRRGSAAMAAVAYTFDELCQLAEKLETIVGG